MKVYISGAVTGTDDYMERFANAEAYLKTKYDVVINPSRVTAALPYPATKWGQYMDVTLACLKDCDAIYMLDGWEKSKGAQIEKLYAEGSGMDVLYQSFASIEDRDEWYRTVKQKQILKEYEEDNK